MNRRRRRRRTTTDDGRPFVPEVRNRNVGVGCVALSGVNGVAAAPLSPWCCGVRGCLVRAQTLRRIEHNHTSGPGRSVRSNYPVVLAPSILDPFEATTIARSPITGQEPIHRPATRPRSKDAFASPSFSFQSIAGGASYVRAYG